MWRDDNRYVELSLTCCATMTEAIGWRRARELTVEASTAELKASLASRWNKRADGVEAPAPSCWACDDTGTVMTSSNGSGLIESPCANCADGIS